MYIVPLSLHVTVELQSRVMMTIKGEKQGTNIELNEMK